MRKAPRVMVLTSIVPDRVSPPARLFLIATVLNGLGNGIFNVVLQLYMTSLGFDGGDIGTIFMMMAVGATLFTVPSGIIADRYGRRRMLLFGFSLAGFSMMLILLDKRLEMFMLAFLLIGLSNAAFVVLTPIYSSFFDEGDMDRAFGLLGFLNIITISMGSLLGCIPPMLVASYGFSLQYAYWIMLAIGGGLFLLQMPLYIMLLRGVVEPKRRGGFELNLRSRAVVAKFFLISLIGTMGGSIFFSLFPYYVNRKFGVESDALGTLFFISNIVSAGANAIAPRVSERMGTLKAIAATIGLCVPFYLMIPMAPNFVWLSALYIGRLALRTMADPLIGSLYMRMLFSEEKATANSLRAMAIHGGNIGAPWLGGQLMERASLDVPAYIGAGLTAVNAASYYILLGKEEKEGELHLPF